MGESSYKALAECRVLMTDCFPVAGLLEVFAASPPSWLMPIASRFPADAALGRIFCIMLKINDIVNRHLSKIEWSASPARDA